MEFHQLTSFVTVARTGNLTRTAKGMCLTSQGEGMEKMARDVLLASDEMQALPWIFPAHPCPFLDTVVPFLKERGMELQNKIFANDDITKAAFIEKGLAVSVLEKSEATGYAQRQKAFFWQGEERFETSLFFVYPRQRAGDRLIRTVTTCLTDTWKIS